MNSQSPLKAIGKTRWAIAEGYLPAVGPHSDQPSLLSHETACILNAGDRNANVTLWIFFKDRDPAGPYRLSVPARRTLHVRFGELSDPERIPRETEYSSLFESDVPVVVQHTRLDARLGAIALLSTIAYSAD